ncbi:MAG: efflux RND transporter periplasmic adaptor subunit [Planctomycetota bacterium]
MRLFRKATLFLSIALTLPTIDVAAQTPVRVVAIQARKMQARHAVTGTLRAVARGNLAALEPGRITDLTVREGDSVRKGDVIARVDARRLEAQKAEVEAELGIASADLERQRAIAERAMADLDRIKQLASSNATSQKEYDSAKADARVAEAAMRSAERQLKRITHSIRLLEVRLSDTEIHAPYDATVVERHVEPGDWVLAGDRLLTLVSTGPIEAWLQVPERYVESLERYGHQVVVRSRATQQDATVLSARRVAEVNPRARTIEFIATISNPDGLLVPGMSVDGWIPVSGVQTQTAVPHDALIRKSGRAYVYRIGENQTAERVPVEILFEAADHVAIASPQITLGDRVVIEGNERLLPGQTVSVIAEPSSPRFASK